MNNYIVKINNSFGDSPCMIDLIVFHCKGLDLIHKEAAEFSLPCNLKLLNYENIK
jgi:hypothetical protein